MQLNLKNDALRRRYDSLKYDIKKIEEGKCFSHLSTDSCTYRILQLFMTSLYANLLIEIINLTSYFIMFYFENRNSNSLLTVGTLRPFHLITSDGNGFPTGAVIRSH
jgi:hypothetical protein